RRALGSRAFALLVNCAARCIYRSPYSAYLLRNLPTCGALRKTNFRRLAFISLGFSYDVSQKPSIPDGSRSLDLYSMRWLEFLLGRSRLELRDLASKAIRYYAPFPLRPKARWFAQKVEPPKKRWIDRPVDPLKAIQSRVQERIL